jgi:cyclophilin family peptidyl-prolyl cis-trans isomerase
MIKRLLTMLGALALLAMLSGCPEQPMPPAGGDTAAKPPENKLLTQNQQGQQGQESANPTGSERGGGGGAGGEAAKPPEETKPSEENKAPEIIPVEKLKTVRKKVHCTMVTSVGTIKIDLYPEMAPIAVANFERLAKAHFYDGVVFHRIVPGFVAQAGQPTSAAMKKLVKDLKDEQPLVDNGPGTLSMAKKGYQNEYGNFVYVPDSASSEFFINVGENSRLNANFSVFGYVVSGMNVVKKIEAAGSPGGQPSEKVIIETVMIGA